MTSRHSAICLAAAALASILLFHKSAQAAEAWSGAAALCQSSTPSHEGALRKRPLALQNEGTATAYVTCNLVAVAAPTELTVYVSSMTSGPKTLSCTAVAGTTSGSASYSAHTVSFTGVSFEPVAMSWFPSHFGIGGNVFPSKLVSLSCALPPGTGINLLILSTQ
jgi:hypothetical protein